MTNMVEVLAWKFSNQAGMEVRGGVITEFPGGIPSQQVQDTWTAEYDARDQQAEQYDREIGSNKLIKAVVLALNDGSFIPGANASPSQIKAAIKAKL